MTWRRCCILVLDELFDLSNIPSRDEIATRIGIIRKSIEYILDLIDDISLLGFPSSPLLPIDWTKISPLQCKCLVIFYLFDEGYEFSIPFWRISWELCISSGFFEILCVRPFIPDLDIILYKWTDIGLT